MNGHRKSHSSVVPAPGRPLIAPTAHLTPLSTTAPWRHHLRPEPDAVIPLVRICGGGREQSRSLLRRLSMTRERFLLAPPLTTPIGSDRPSCGPLLNRGTNKEADASSTGGDACPTTQPRILALAASGCRLADALGRAATRSIQPGSHFAPSGSLRPTEAAKSNAQYRMMSAIVKRLPATN
jgi:hypothetical protein